MRSHSMPSEATARNESMASAPDGRSRFTTPRDLSHHTSRFTRKCENGGCRIDQDYRQRAKAKERAHAAGFGPSLRRLRKQRGLSQSDFPNVARKTIYRIETGEIEKPHGTTLNRIARTLGVAPEEIEAY